MDATSLYWFLTVTSALAMSWVMLRSNFMVPAAGNLRTFRILLAAFLALFLLLVAWQMFDSEVLHPRIARRLRSFTSNEGGYWALILLPWSLGILFAGAFVFNLIRSRAPGVSAGRRQPPSQE